MFETICSQNIGYSLSTGNVDEIQLGSHFGLHLLDHSADVGNMECLSLFFLNWQGQHFLGVASSVSTDVSFSEFFVGNLHLDHDCRVYGVDDILGVSKSDCHDVEAVPVGIKTMRLVGV